MKPVFAVQVTNRDDEDLHQTVRAITGAGYEWINFGVVPFTDEITNLDAFPTDRRVIPLAGTKVINLYRRKKLPSNWHVFYSDTLFDQCYTRFGPIHFWMLNRNAVIYSYEHCRSLSVKVPTFVKPSNDLKVFAGTVLETGQSLDAMLSKVNHQPISNGEQIVMAPVRELGAEYRLFIINGAVVDGSEYKREGRVGHKVIDTHTAFELDAFYKKVKPLIGSSQVVQLRDREPLAYCMDVVEVKDNLDSRFEIVEFNCFNACGMYKADRMLVLSELGAVVEATKWD